MEQTVFYIVHVAMEAYVIQKRELVRVLPVSLGLLVMMVSS